LTNANSNIIVKLACQTLEKVWTYIYIIYSQQDILWLMTFVLLKERKGYIQVSSILFILYQSNSTGSTYYLSGRFSE
jgi:hypothetical protein